MYVLLRNPRMASCLVCSGLVQCMYKYYRLVSVTWQLLLEGLMASPCTLSILPSSLYPFLRHLPGGVHNVQLAYMEYCKCGDFGGGSRSWGVSKTGQRSRRGLFFHDQFYVKHGYLHSCPGIYQLVRCRVSLHTIIAFNALNWLIFLRRKLKNLELFFNVGKNG